MRILILLVAAMSIVGCSDDKPKATSTKKEIFVKGDPMNYVKGATFNTTFDLDYLEQSPKLYLFSAVSFIEKAEVQRKKMSKADMEEENRAKESAEAGQKEKAEFEFQLYKKGNRVYLDGPQTQTTFLLDKSNRIIETTVTNTDGTHDPTGPTFELLHTSFGHRGRLMSLLFKVEAQNNTAVMSVYFTNDNNFENSKNLKKTDEKYHYVLGKGIKSKVDQDGPINFDLCGLNRLLEKEARQEIKKWSDALQGLVEVNVNAPHTYAPFSDLNQSCLYLVDSYIEAMDSREKRYAVTYSQPSPNTGLLIDGDVFILKKEFEKHRLPIMSHKLEFRRRYALVHEMGHYFGLDHKMKDGDSVMSYKFKDTDLNQYDREAVQELYRK